MVSRLASVETSVVSFQGTVAARSVILAMRDSKISNFSLKSCETISQEHCQIGRCDSYYNSKFKKTSYHFIPGMTMLAGDNLDRLTLGRHACGKLIR